MLKKFTTIVDVWKKYENYSTLFVINMNIFFIYLLFLAVVEDVNGLLRKNMILYSGTFIMLTERTFQMG
jgi:hypothetical protein